MDNLAEWDALEAPSEINVSEFDKMVQDYKHLEDDYKAKKKISGEAYALMEEQEAKIVAALTASKKSKYFVDGVGTAYLINRYVVTTPKTNANKALLMDYIRSRYGEETLLSKIGVNHQTLQGFYNEEMAALAKEGKEPVIPGLDSPTHEIGLGIRKA